MAQLEEDRQLRMAMAASLEEGPSENPNNPNVDEMTYEQLLEMQDRAGHVSRGLK